MTISVKDWTDFRDGPFEDLYQYGKKITSEQEAEQIKQEFERQKLEVEKQKLQSMLRRE